MRSHCFEPRQSPCPRLPVTAPRYSAAVRILHTSDWHLGRSFHGASLMHEQEEVIDRIVELARDQKVDLVVIAGDLYDRAIPPTDAVTLFGDALERLSETGAKIVAVAGNHDSPSRVAVADRVLERAGVAVRGDVSRCIQPLQFDPADGGPRVSVYLVPYLEPSLAAPALTQLDETSEAEGTRHAGHHEVTDYATELIRRHVSGNKPTRTVVVAHTFVDGGKVTDSERALSIGNIDRVGVSAFGGFDYVALGHLHRDQSFDDGRLAYSGSPLPYSFSEENHTKSVRIVEMDAAGQCTTEVVPLNIGRPLRTLSGRIDDLLKRAVFADAEQARVRFRLTDPEPPLQAMSRLKARFPHAAMLEHKPHGRLSARESGIVHAMDGLESSEEPLELALRFWARQHGAVASDAQRDILAAALEATVRGNEA